MADFTRKGISDGISWRSIPRTKKGTDILTVLEDLGDWQPTADDIFNLLSLQ
jgi:hypothetical protein